MSTIDYYCHTCARELYPTENIYSDFNFTGSYDGYQLDKFIKHTTATPLLGYTSSFVDNSYDSYKDYMVKTISSGSLEVVTNGNWIQKNYVFLATKKVGELYVDGEYLSDEDAVKVVLSDNENKIHCYSTGSFGLKEAICKKCGCKIFN